MRLQDICLNLTSNAYYYLNINKSALESIFLVENTAIICARIKFGSCNNYATKVR